MESNYINGSDYLLLSAAIKHALEQNNINTKFNHEKHAVKVEVGFNKNGKAYGTFWFIKKKKGDEFGK